LLSLDIDITNAAMAMWCNSGDTAARPLVRNTLTSEQLEREFQGCMTKKKLNGKKLLIPSGF